MQQHIVNWLNGLRCPNRPDEYEVKDLLARVGIAAPEGYRLAPDADIAVPGFPAPYVLKVCAPEILHKTDARGVMLNVLADGFHEAVFLLRERFPGNHLLVESQVVFDGQEVIIGALVDPTMGPAVMVGAGGIFTELLRDVAFRLPPFDESEALRMLKDLQIYPVFDGFRGIRLDSHALARQLSTIGDLALALGDRLNQLDINPVVWNGEEWIALDAKLLLT
jgi:succinyl-CoA synthetase beta subunit